MHILLTNDDGPPDDRACPYIKYFVDEVRRTTPWKLLIVVPDQQRSWIGKAHFAGKTLTPTYAYTPHDERTQGPANNAYQGPFAAPNAALAASHQEWVLVDSTPAACADIGLHHVRSHPEPVDLVVSGPNFGKNAGNLYILASGTVGAALEAVTHGARAIALLYEFRSLHHDPAVLREAARLLVRLVHRLWRLLLARPDVDLFSVNVPLVPLLGAATPVRVAPVLRNTWGSIYRATAAGTLEWAPDFDLVARAGARDRQHSDSRVLLEDAVCVTPLRAGFADVGGFGDADLAEAGGGDDCGGQDSVCTALLKATLADSLALPPDSLSPAPRLVFLLSAPASYLSQPLVHAFSSRGFAVETAPSLLQQIPSDPLLRVFHYADYEHIDLDLVQSHPRQYFVPSYIYRKALIRKHYLANTVHHYVAKHPDSPLAAAFPQSYLLEVDYAEFLDDALDDAYELRDEINRADRTWILKPSMSDKGQGIRLFRSVDQLQAIFDSFEVDSDAEDDDTHNGVIISQLRHFVVQEYQQNPLLLAPYHNRKFHLRVYVVCQANLKVYVYHNILALFADAPYAAPLPTAGAIDLAGHLTNTCLQDGADPLVVPFWDLQGLGAAAKASVFAQVKAVTGQLYQAAASVDRINFQPMENAVEIFGLDFLVSSDLAVTLLEVNSYPDFKQTGDDLKLLIFTLFAAVAAGPVCEMMGAPSTPQDTLHAVFDAST